MISNLFSGYIKDIRQFLYQSVEDDHFGYWSCIPDWSGYCSYLNQVEDLKSGISFGGIWLEQCIPNESWGLASKNWEYHLRLFLVRYLNCNEARVKVQQEVLGILKLSENYGMLLKSELSFDGSELSLMMRRAGIALTCGELKLKLMVNEK